MLVEDFYKLDANADADADAGIDADADADGACLVESSTCILLEMMMLDIVHAIGIN